jgi:hypothetical protein
MRKVGNSGAVDMGGKDIKMLVISQKKESYLGLSSNSC